MDREYSIMLWWHEKVFFNEIILTSHRKTADQKLLVISFFSKAELFEIKTQKKNGKKKEQEEKIRGSEPTQS